MIVEAKTDANTDYWMRTVPQTGCGTFNGGIVPDNATAIVKYNRSVPLFAQMILSWALTAA